MSVSTSNPNCSECCRDVKGFVTYLVDDYGWAGSEPVLGETSCLVEITTGSVDKQCIEPLKQYLCNKYSRDLTDDLLNQARSFMNDCLSSTVTLSDGSTIPCACNLPVYLDTTNKYENNPNYPKWANKPGLLAEKEFDETICFRNCDPGTCSIR